MRFTSINQSINQSSQALRCFLAGERPAGLLPPLPLLLFPPPLSPPRSPLAALFGAFAVAEKLLELDLELGFDFNLELGLDLDLDQEPDLPSSS